MPDYEARRRIMVDTQVRPSDVTKFPIIDAMLTVPRELFVPDAMREAAYAERNIEIGERRVILEPRTLAKMFDALAITSQDLVLNIGCGTGYSAAVAGHMAEAVVAVEEDAELAAEAISALAEAGVENVAVETSPLVEGAAEHGPYDVIFITGAVEQVPEALLGQLKDGGRIGAVFVEGELGVARVGIKISDQVSWRYSFNATAPVLPGFERAQVFAL